jgi:hypothetical protein
MARKELSPSEVLEAALGVNPAVWSVSVGYAKGFLSGSRGLHLTVKHLPSGREKHGFTHALGKAAARRDAVALAKKWMKELS